MRLGCVLRASGLCLPFVQVCTFSAWDWAPAGVPLAVIVLLLRHCCLAERHRNLEDKRATGAENGGH